MSRGALVLLLAVPLVGCGPSLSSLVRDRHYREAVCAVAGGDAAPVMDAMVDDADVTVRAHRMTEGELAAIHPDAPTALAPRASVVVVELDSRRMPLDELTAEVTFLDAGEPAGMPATRSALIWASAETEPAPEVMETGLTPANTLLALGYVVTGGLPLLFGGLAAVATGTSFDPFPDRALVSVPASEQEYERLAPIAIALDRSLPRCTPGMGPALRCRGALLVDPRLTRGALRVTVRASARRISRRGETLEESCVATRDYIVPWEGLGDDVDGALAPPPTHGRVESLSPVTPPWRGLPRLTR